MKRKNEKRYYLLGFIIILLLFALYNKPLNKEVIPSKFIVTKNMGFDLTPGKLNFGEISPGNGASREIAINNKFDKQIKIKIKSSGEISDSLTVSENNFILKPKESKNITFSVYIKNSTKFGEYKGNIIILSEK